MNNKIMNYTEACDQALRLREQGRTYKDIGQHLVSVGYKSSRTGKNVCDVAVRYMIIQAEKRNKREEKAELEDQKIYVAAEEASKEKAIKVLLGVPGLSDAVKMKLIKALVDDDSLPPTPAMAQVVSIDKKQEAARLAS